jgi:hypothetical protein
MRIIEITENKVDKMSSLVEEMLSIGGKLMTCIEHLDESYGERRREYPEDDEYRMGERRGMRGRYSRY